MLQTKEPLPKPRPIDQLLEIYIKIGGVVGVGLSAAVFGLICLLSFKMFFGMHFNNFHSAVFDVLFILGTIFCAGTAAVSTFFCASVFWLPILIGVIFFAAMLQDLLLRLQQHFNH